MSLELFVRSLYTRADVTRHPCFSWAFLILLVTKIAHCGLCGGVIFLVFYCKIAVKMLKSLHLLMAF